MMDHRARSEAIERSAVVSLHEHCPAHTRESLGLFDVVVGDTLVAGAGKERSIVLNRALGLGLEEPQSLERVRKIDAAYREHGVERYFLHAYEDSVEGGVAALAQLPLEKARAWMKFVRGNEAPPEHESSLRVERVDAGAALDFGRIVAAAFGMGPNAGPLLAGLVNDPRWQLFLSYDGTAPAGAGAVFIDGDSALFDWAATSLAFRKRGSHGAILVARIAAAIEAGCTSLYTETGEAAPGDPQHSYRNLERFGFRADELRMNWAPPSK